MRERCQQRPDSGGDNIGAAVFVYWERDEVIIYLDTSGEPLSKRGYRRIPGSAPMQETLAAACLMGMGWKGDRPFLSPMCGSGTPAIEAAMIAMNKAPGSLKGHFAFQSIKGYSRIIPGEKAPTVAPRQTAGATPEQIWKEMVLEAKKEERRDNLPRIIATDISPEAVDNAQTNAITAGVAEFIEFHACDFAETPVPEVSAPPPGETKGCVFFNPEYGIRLGDPEELKPIYARIGTFMNAPRRPRGAKADLRAHRHLHEREVPRLDRRAHHRQSGPRRAGKPLLPQPDPVLQRTNRLQALHLRRLRAEGTKRIMKFEEFLQDKNSQGGEPSSSPYEPSSSPEPEEEIEIQKAVVESLAADKVKIEEEATLARSRIAALEREKAALAARVAALEGEVASLKAELAATRRLPPRARSRFSSATSTSTTASRARPATMSSRCCARRATRRRRRDATAAPRSSRRCCSRTRRSASLPRAAPRWRSSSPTTATSSTAR